MKSFRNSKTAKTIISTTMAVMIAASAAVSLCVSTVCASTFSELRTIKAVTETADSFIINARDGETYTIDRQMGSSTDLSFIGTDGYHYYIDDKCMAVAKEGYGIISVFDTGIWDNGRQLTEIAGVPLKDIIHLTNGLGEMGYVTDIRTCYENGWIYDYTMHLHGKAGDNALHDQYWLYFSDEEGDTYTLKLNSESYKEHTVNYNSTAYKFNKIVWMLR